MQPRTPMRTLTPRLAPPHRTRRTRLLAAFSLFMAGCSALLGLGVPPATAQSDAPATDSSSQVRIVEISGLIDPVITDFVLGELDDAEANGVLAVVLQLDSKGSVLDPAAFEQLAGRLEESDVPIAIWVGPSGSVAYGGAAELLGVADLVGVAAGSRIGKTGELRLGGEPLGAATGRLEDQTITAEEAIELGISVGPLETSSVLREFVGELPGYEGVVEGTESAEDLSQPQFRQLPLTLQLFHTVASPEVAYLFFVGGLALLVFELFTAGVGIAGAIGAFLLIMGCYGLAVLPIRPSAVVMLVLANLAFAVDIQTNIPRIYSGIGMVLFAIGTFTLYDGVSLSVITIGVGLIGAALYAYAGMPSMVRTRFSSPTIGRSWIIGEFGEATSDIDPEGTVIVRDAPWRAITNRATPLKAGDRVRVVGLDRMLLEVAPEEGGAKDYRDRG